MNYRRKVMIERQIVPTGGLAVQLNVLDNRPQPLMFDDAYPPIDWMDQCAYCLDRPDSMPAGGMTRYWSGQVIQAMTFIG